MEATEDWFVGVPYMSERIKQVKKLKAGRQLSTFGGHGVNRQLNHMRSNEAVYWSRGGNSYVVVQIEEPQRIWGTVSDPGYHIVSINGIGEIRWSASVSSASWMDADTRTAVDYFFEDVDDEAMVPAGV